MARPNHFTSEQMITALKETNGLVSLAARKLGCSQNAIYKRSKRSPEVRAAIEDSRAELVDHAEQALHAAVLRGEPWAVALVLKTLGKGRGYTERTEVTGADGAPIEIVNLGVDVDRL